MKLLLFQVAEKLYDSNLRMILSGKLLNGILSISHFRSQRSISCLKVTILWPCLAIAILPGIFTQLHVDNAWSEEFLHPLMGWDHILVMVAVGIWAAQIRGQALWILPAVFVGVMSLGGLTGAASYAIPGAEAMVLLSCFTISALIACGPRCWGMNSAGRTAFRPKCSTC